MQNKLFIVFTTLYTYLSVTSLPIPTYVGIIKFPIREELDLNHNWCSDKSITKRLLVFFI